MWVVRPWGLFCDSAPFVQLSALGPPGSMASGVLLSHCVSGDALGRKGPAERAVCQLLCVGLALLFTPLLGVAQGEAWSFLQVPGNCIVQWGKKSPHCV